MLYANVSGIRSEATPGGRGKCPTCSEDVIAKCGSILSWHWSHRTDSECDPWWEPVGPWHLSWQEEVPAIMREVTIKNHRADIVSHDGTVVELQDSGISVEEVHEREQFYGNMVWIFNATQSFENYNFDFWRKGEVTAFRWRYPRKVVMYCQKRVLLDLGNGEVFKLGKIYDNKPYGGWGWLLKRQDVVSRILGTNPDLRIQRDVTVLDWRGHRTGEPMPCVVCGRNAICRDSDGEPCHKLCAEEVIA